MKKQQFYESVRRELKKIPLDTRKKWNTTDLFIWWGETKNNNPHLTWERAPTDLWQHVQAMCGDLIGERALA